MISTPETPCNKLRCRGALVARIRKWNEVPNPTDNDFLYGLWFLRGRLSPDKITKNQGERVGGGSSLEFRSEGAAVRRGRIRGEGAGSVLRKPPRGIRRSPSELRAALDSCSLFNSNLIDANGQRVPVVIGEPEVFNLER